MRPSLHLQLVSSNSIHAAVLGFVERFQCDVPAKFFKLVGVCPDFCAPPNEVGGWRVCVWAGGRPVPAFQLFLAIRDRWALGWPTHVNVDRAGAIAVDGAVYGMFAEVGENGGVPPLGP